MMAMHKVYTILLSICGGYGTVQHMWCILYYTPQLVHTVLHGACGVYCTTHHTWCMLYCITHVVYTVPHSTYLVAVHFAS